jgi:fatty acid desaturase
MKYIIRDMIVGGIINWRAPWWGLSNTWRVACGNFKGEWELKLFPVGSPERAAGIRWARFLLIGHAIILAFSIYFHLWILPFLTSFSGFFGGALQTLCNSAQHVGLQDDVSDFRLCCRTFTVNPFVQFLYWHMNYHIEHHMFAAVPCYRLGRLHRLIKHDLPPCPHGLVATWKEIGAILEIQKADPDYQHVAPLPAPQNREVVPA